MQKKDILIKKPYDFNDISIYHRLWIPKVLILLKKQIIIALKVGIFFIEKDGGIMESDEFPDISIELFMAMSLTFHVNNTILFFKNTIFENYFDICSDLKVFFKLHSERQIFIINLLNSQTIFIVRCFLQCYIAEKSILYILMGNKKLIFYSRWLKFYKNRAYNNSKKFWKMLWKFINFQNTLANYWEFIRVEKRTFIDFCHYQQVDVDKLTASIKKEKLDFYFWLQPFRDFYNVQKKRGGFF